MIDSKDISIIVQGAVKTKETTKCLKSLRKYLPQAEIILSTWEGSDVSVFDGLYDILIFNKDPGAVILHLDIKDVPNNLNRQLLSTKEGLKRATKKYAMKFRTDFCITSNEFLEYFDKYQARNEQYKLFERKLLCSTSFSRKNYGDNNEKGETLFHPADFWFFGLTTDLRKLFDETPLVNEPDFSNYFAKDENKAKISPYYSYCRKMTCQFASEQYIGYSAFVRNYPELHMDDASDFDEELIKKSRICMINNFIPLEFAQSGIYTDKYPYTKEEKFLGQQYLGLYNNHYYEQEYKIFCDSSFEIKAGNLLFKNAKITKAILKAYKHYYKLIDKETKPLKKLEEICISLPCAVVNLIIVLSFNFFINKK